METGKKNVAVENDKSTSSAGGNKTIPTSVHNLRSRKIVTQVTQPEDVVKTGYTDILTDTSSLYFCINR